jgi:1-deoxy-D-xylulose-5-phosphate reductoisomerase
MGLARRLTILGSTGSIGRNALDVVGRLGGRIEVVGLAAKENWRLLAEQAVKFGARSVAIYDEGLLPALKDALWGRGIRVLGGEEGLLEISTYDDVDMVLAGMSGISGLLPVLEAIKRGKDIALANKEILVAAGPILKEAMRSSGSKIIPVDSEHSAVFHSMLGRGREWVRRIILTATGGPFWGKEVDLSSVMVEDVLEHPVWKMGRKITVDSATMMNKGLEVIEACYLFDVSPSMVEVLIHPECVVHSMVEFSDGMVIGQMGVADMRIPIQAALTFPDVVDSGLPSLDLASVGRLSFYKPDMDRFPCLRLGYEAARIGGTMTAVLSAANEEAVMAFLSGAIPFSRIPALIEMAMEEHEPIEDPSLDLIFDSDRWARERVREVVKG